MKKILLCITASIAAYKSAEIASRLAGKGYDVHVIMTANSTKFISPMVFETLTKNRVRFGMFSEDEPAHLAHVTSATESDLIVVAPATYNIIGKAACGFADDLVSSVLAAAPAEKVIYAPAMNDNMYRNPALKENMAALKRRGSQIIEPEEGMLACGVVGRGRMRNPQAILEKIDAFFCEKSLEGRRVLITAGATREYLDPIRFISNSSSGLMGLCLAKACRDRGAQVTLILANSSLAAEDVELLHVGTVSEMYEAALARYPDADLVFAAAAVSDYKPTTFSPKKIKKTADELKIVLERNTDILLELGRRKKKQILIGFAAESEDLIENALEKLERKNLDLIIANGLSNFGSTSGSVTIVSKESILKIPELEKEKLAAEIVTAVTKGGLF